LTSPLEPGGAEPLVDLWLQHDPDVSAVSGVPGTAQAIAEAWEHRTGGSSRRTFSEAMHVLEEVRDPPRPSPGTLRMPRPDERDLLVGWMEEFVGEAGLIGASQAASMVDGRLRQRGLLVWDDGEPVSMVGVNPPVAGVVRIGPVYTPRPLRRQGYAGSAVAVGYQRCGDWEEIALEPR
jgi:predicted GNAT family acetyltransferase